MDYCKKPCHDCPFRSDIVPYQTEQDVQRNSTFVKNPYGTAFCHHTVYLAKPRVCAGFIIMCYNDKVKHEWSESILTNIKNKNLVFESLNAFIKYGRCSEQDTASRIEAWLQSQPSHRRERLLKSMQNK